MRDILGSDVIFDTVFAQATIECLAIHVLLNVPFHFSCLYILDLIPPLGSIFRWLKRLLRRTADRPGM
jgi:hypothetical protein